MRQLILDRIQLLSTHHSESPKWEGASRWNVGVYVQGNNVPLRDADFTQMTDEELVDAFQTVVSRWAKQG